MTETVKIFDTTLRDGEQSPGCTMNLKEKLQVARQLEKLNVDIIEAGFAASSKGDFTSIEEISKIVTNATVAGLSRLVENDIDLSFDALKNAQNPRLHLFIATSPIHMQYKLKMSPDEVLSSIENSVKYAKTKFSDIEFSAEDATRSEFDFLIRAINTAIKAGATTINIPDTVGYSTPLEFSAFISKILENLVSPEKITLSVHCHNDLGLATANSLAAVKSGARQVECTINGIGERAGNAAMEEIVMALNVRNNFYNAKTGINTQFIVPSSRTVSAVTGSVVQPNKAIVGKNAFLHEAGIHQHGVMENKATYEIMTPEEVGYKEQQLILGKHSGRHAFENWLTENNHVVTKEEEKELFKKFKQLCDKKKTITERDLEALVQNKISVGEEKYKLKRFVINVGNTITSTAVLTVSVGGKDVEDVAIGDGPVDASFKAIEKIAGITPELDDYNIRSITQGVDSLGEALVRLKYNGHYFKGRGLSTDVIEASIFAYIDAVNKLEAVVSKEGSENEN